MGETRSAKKCEESISWGERYCCVLRREGIARRAAVARYSALSLVLSHHTAGLSVGRSVEERTYGRTDQNGPSSSPTLSSSSEGPKHRHHPRQQRTNSTTLKKKTMETEDDRSHTFSSGKKKFQKFSRLTFPRTNKLVVKMFGNPKINDVLKRKLWCVSTGKDFDSNA